MRSSGKLPLPWIARQRPAAIACSSLATAPVAQLVRDGLPIILIASRQHTLSLPPDREDGDLDRDHGRSRRLCRRCVCLCVAVLNDDEEGEVELPLRIGWPSPVRLAVFLLAGGGGGGGGGGAW